MSYRVVDKDLGTVLIDGLTMEKARAYARSFGLAWEKEEEEEDDD